MIFSEDGEFPNVDSQPSGATLTLTLDPLSGFWSWDGVPRARESGTAERNKAVGNAKKQGGELSRGQRSRVIPRSSGKVSRRKRSKKTGRRVMKETQKRSVIGRRTCPKCQECRQGGWQLAQPRPFPAGTLGGLDTWLSLPQGTDRKLGPGMADSGALREPWGGRAELARGPDPAVERTDLAVAPAWCLLQVASLCHAAPDPRWQLSLWGPCCS